MRNLCDLVREVLRCNVNMATRMRNLEKMHPAFSASAGSSQDDISGSEASRSRAASRLTCSAFAFEDELGMSTVYKRAAAHHLRFSQSSNSSGGLSYLSGLSLSDVSNVSAIALPIFSMDLWNHHRYSSDRPGKNTTNASSLEAWYNPPAMVR